MNILFLGGNSQRHQTWIHKMADELKSPFDEVVVHEYAHWKTGEPWADIDHEVVEISAKMANMAPFVVFAKSIGTMICLKAIYEERLHPKACVFLGMPLNAITDMNLPAINWLEACKVPLYFIHNQDDPIGSVDELRNFLPENIDRANVTVLNGNTHDYNDTVVMAELLARAGAE